MYNNKYSMQFESCSCLICNAPYLLLRLLHPVICLSKSVTGILCLIYEFVFSSVNFGEKVSMTANIISN